MHTNNPNLLSFLVFLVGVMCGAIALLAFSEGLQEWRAYRTRRDPAILCDTTRRYVDTKKSAHKTLFWSGIVSWAGFAVGFTVDIVVASLLLTVALSAMIGKLWQQSRRLVNVEIRRTELHDDNVHERDRRDGDGS